jgi:hypothetical protein
MRELILDLLIPLHVINEFATYELDGFPMLGANLLPEPVQPQQKGLFLEWSQQ